MYRDGVDFLLGHLNQRGLVTVATNWERALLVSDCPVETLNSNALNFVLKSPRLLTIQVFAHRLLNTDFLFLFFLRFKQNWVNWFVNNRNHLIVVGYGVLYACLNCLSKVLSESGEAKALRHVWLLFFISTFCLDD